MKIPFSFPSIFHDKRFPFACKLTMTSILAVWGGMTASTASATHPLLLPPETTQDLVVLEEGCGCILRVTPTGEVSIELSRSEILAVANSTGIGFDQENPVFDGDGNLYFAESSSESVIKRSKATGVLSVLARRSDILTLLGTGVTGLDLEAMVLGSDGFLYIVDEENDALIRIDPETGAVSLLANREKLETALPPGSEVDLERGLVGGAEGVIYAFSDGVPDTMLAVFTNGTVGALLTGRPFEDPDRFATRAPTGEIIIYDDGNETVPHRIFAISPGGTLDTFFTEASLSAVTGGPLEPAGLTFDSNGSFFVADSNSGILKFNREKVGSYLVRNSAVIAATGVAPKFGGIAFEPVHKLYFAQFADGQGLFSQIILSSLDKEDSAEIEITLRDQAGELLSIDLNDVVVNGQFEDVAPPSGKKVYATDGKGNTSVGSVTVCSDQPLSGVILFGGSIGLAGVQSSKPIGVEGLTAPIETQGISEEPLTVNTGIAVMNLSMMTVTLDAELLDSFGAVIATAKIELVSRGQTAKFVNELTWNNQVDFRDFQGNLRVTPTGPIAATVIQTRPNQFATMPVGGLIPQLISSVAAEGQ